MYLNLIFKIKLSQNLQPPSPPKTRPFWHRLTFHQGTVNYVMLFLYSQVLTRRKHCATQENDDKQKACPCVCTVIYIKLTSVPCWLWHPYKRAFTQLGHCLTVTLNNQLPCILPSCRQFLPHQSAQDSKPLSRLQSTTGWRPRHVHSVLNNVICPAIIIHSYTYDVLALKCDIPVSCNCITHGTYPG
jgi:hypothetical protein